MLHAQSLSNLPGIRHGFFTRVGGVSDGIYESLNGGVGSEDSPAKVAENRARMAARLGVAPERFLTCYQIHSPEVVVAETPWPASERPRADALVTRVPGLAIGVSTADCGPVLLADAEARVIGAAHAGWRGALAGVTDATIAAMEKLGARRHRIAAAVGPCIAQLSYEVDTAFRDRFCLQEPGSERFFIESASGKPHFDLPAYVVHRLIAAGVEQVEALHLDTYAEPDRFYSYRRSTHRGEADYGRQASLIALA